MVGDAVGDVGAEVVGAEEGGAEVVGAEVVGAEVVGVEVGVIVGTAVVAAQVPTCVAEQDRYGAGVPSSSLATLLNFITSSDA